MDDPRPARADDVPAIRTVCALAYAENPLMAWVLPVRSTREDACAAWLGPALERYVDIGYVDVLTAGAVGEGADRPDEVVAVAAWRPRHADGAPEPPPRLPRPAGVLRALVGPSRAEEVLAALGDTAAYAPPHAGAYLNYLAVHPAYQGRGLGGVLLQHGLRALAGSPWRGTPWLATSDPHNVPFYARRGFAVAGSHVLGVDGPRLTVMHGRG
ncbi:GNAT family N-acetyltransferase [Cellulomonas shaoxiangyii]|uniref:N-acetyltransferase n=1 Tax=Cellulomonas shaoxiangyii TaxID=2566013 RepID=A0A4P7SKD6_9CELL|nr:GNAT family N-acetyltransferase [Cellulomonas shaoxiangyii]QCB93194.1 N-acetyltransferase [Cellulomonas shaoxiangyii]TGY80686.1 N-acetyltransferase [Cellulomonas shaoxiangyii]